MKVRVTMDIEFSGGIMPDDLADVFQHNMPELQDEMFAGSGIEETIETITNVTVQPIEQE